MQFNFIFLNIKILHYLDWASPMIEQASILLKRSRYIRNVVKNSLTFWRRVPTREHTHSYMLPRYSMGPVKTSNHFTIIRKCHKTQGVVQWTRKKVILTRKPKGLLKRVFSLSYTMNGVVKSPPHRWIVTREQCDRTLELAILHIYSYVKNYLYLKAYLVD